MGCLCPKSKKPTVEKKAANLQKNEKIYKMLR